MDRLAAMQVFVKAVELGSFSAAAAALDISSQLAGKQIQSLETGLGVKLLNRTTRRQTLTESGGVFYERAKNILAEMEAAEALIAESVAVPRGRLRISAPITFGSHALAPRVPEYLKMHPEVSIDLSLTNRTVDLLDEGFDIVFRTGELPDSGLQGRALAPLRLVLCASPSYVARSQPLRRPQDLEIHECLIFSHTSMRTQWLFESREGRISVPIMGRFATDSGEALRAAAVAGHGILLQPLELVGDDLRAGRLLRLLPEYEPPPRALHMLFAPDRRMPPKVRSFLDYASKQFR
ncbi:LysR family transcriptional regulator [Agrobacterium tumefaciens]|uniref:LysR family transcriptional regulator n=1 Tax=Agrobacterium tumefaciens TaxID=358 RepID=UPI0015740E34|nr:LysR family transcriptional regulator [Agrobacterium tumefaciens]NTB99225.1 LysR family transcriptional regulator [Agrobacterium tumefaciens]NTC47422.1 LysR family transcriptional regulator [Agrobacterium tumefaciens]